MKILKLDFLLIIAGLIFGICFIISGSIEKGNFMNITIEFLVILITIIVTITIILQYKIFPDKMLAVNYSLMSNSEDVDKKSFKRCYILAQGGHFNGNEFDIIGRTLSIGKDKSKCNVVFPDDVNFIAEKHCQLYYDDESNSVVIQNTNLKYSTFKDDNCKMLNGKLYYLKNDEEFYIGNSKNKFVVRIEEEM